MKKINSFYSDLLTDTRVNKRIWVLDEAAKIILGPLYGELRVNTDLLTVMVKSYFVDIDRLKHLHDIELIEKYKIAAYTSKWILKLRPITWVAERGKNVSKEVLLSNERFALQFGISLAEIDQAVITPEFTNETLYMFHYRDVSAESLTHWYSALGGSADLEYD